ncbi:hypothetical protein LCGC14_0756480 [marine sediment metagenome]|uniref:Photosynthesis system II assembly factor Ycf48/Hcf136-like domain-containing protein n=1 Tax=marine sediment metagenome TaxID=412755 RepID=A0A0F9SMM8_9ZZZZ
MSSYAYQDGRVWVQEKKFEPYKLLLPYGITDVTDPVGGLNPVREPDPAKRRSTVVVDVLKGEPGLPGFSVETRLNKTLNYMLKLKNQLTNWQVHLGACGRPDNYNASEIGLSWDAVHRGDLSIDRVAQIQGDDTPIAKSVPFTAEVGPIPIDFELELLSAQTIVETEAVSDMAFIVEECDDISTQHEPGDNGYAVTKTLAGSPVNVANVHYTVNGGTAWPECSARPFEGGEDISSIVLIGDKNDHRIIVSRGTTDAGEPAEIAYADVTVMGTTSWVLVDVGTVDGQYITHLFLLDWNHIYAVTDDGYVYRSSDGGASWTAKLSLGTVQFNESSWLRHGIGWVGGDSNTIYLTKDYGESWSAVTGPTAGSGDAIDTIHVTPDGTVFIGNDAGEMYGSYDDGTAWTVLPTQGVTPIAIKRIRGLDDSHLFVALNIAGPLGRVLRSTDGGAQFQLWSLNIPTNVGLNALFVVDPNYIYIGGEPQGSSAFITKASSQIQAIPS